MVSEIDSLISVAFGHIPNATAHSLMYQYEVRGESSDYRHALRSVLRPETGSITFQRHYIH